MRLDPAVERRALELAGVPLGSALPAGISEAEFRREVIRVAQMLGWRVAGIRPVRVQRRNGKTYHETPMEADGNGWPDLILVRGEDMLAIELKVGRNKPTLAQLGWLRALAGVRHVRAADMRPADWGELRRVLEKRP